MDQLNLIYRVARMANVPAETHEAVTKAANELMELLQPTQGTTADPKGDKLDKKTR